jgi:flagellar biosynthesis protein FlhB
MGEKTEAPTPRKRDEARSKGQGIGRSHELSMSLTLGVGTLALSSLLPGMVATMVSRTQTAILTLDPHASNARLIGATGDAILAMVFLILPLALVVMVAGVAGNLVSGGLVLSARAIRFDFSRLNPVSGLKRIIDKQAMIRLGIASAKLVILAFISWQVVGSRIPAIVGTEGADISTIAGTCLSAIFQLGLTITILLAVVALVDYVVQRRRANESLRMTKEEVKQEYKEQEGDPLVRGARRRRARQMAFARMMDAVPTADVVVTNPTTLAVALKYDSLTMRAPRIVAKGQRLMAERIKQIARDNRVPIVEDKPLARALFPRPIGAEVPAHLYRAVARLLVLVHQARFAAGGRGRNGTDAGDAARGWQPGSATTARALGTGLPTRPWWADAADSAGAAESVAGAAAAGAAGFGEIDPTGAPDDATRVGPQDDDAEVAPPQVDEEALAAAMAEDELADLTPEELAQYEADLEGSAEAMGAADDSTDPDEELKR